MKINWSNNWWEGPDPWDYPEVYVLWNLLLMPCILGGGLASLVFILVDLGIIQ